MNWNRMLAASFLGLCFLMASSVGTVVLCQNRSTQTDTTAPATARIDPKSSPVLLLAEAYQESGYTWDQANALALHSVLGLPLDVELPTRAPVGAVLIDPKSDPVVLLWEIYHESGYTEDEAMKFALRSMGLGDSGAPASPQCAMYPVRIVYCSGSNEYTLATWLNGRCWDDPDGDPSTNDGLRECLVCECLSEPTEYKSPFQNELTN